MPDQTMQIDTPLGIQAYLAGHGGIKGIHVIRNSSGGLQMSVVSQGQVKSGVNAQEEKDIALNEQGDLIVAQGMPAGVEMSRLGAGWSAIATAAVAALVVRPGTVAGFTLWNGEAIGGRSYVIDRLFTHNLVGTAAISSFGIWACVHPPGMTDPGIDIARSATNLTGNTGKKYDGAGVVGVGETVVDDGWYPWGDGQATTPVTNTVPGPQAVAEVAGRLIIPPSGGISLQVVASITGLTMTTGLSWYEAQLALQ